MKNYLIGFMLGVWMGPVIKAVATTLAKRELERQEKKA